MNNSNRVLQYLGCLSYLIVMKLETFGNQTHEQMCCRPQLRQFQAPGALLSNILMPIQGDTLALSQDADLICHICLIHPGRGFAWLAWLGQTFVFTPKYGHSLAFGTSGVSAYDSACKDSRLRRESNVHVLGLRLSTMAACTKQHDAEQRHIINKKYFNDLMQHRGHKPFKLKPSDDDYALIVICDQMPRAGHTKGWIPTLANITIINFW